VFNTVELNGTFYRMPKINDLKKYALVTPPDFRFSVKMSRYVTHVNRLKEQQPITEFQNLVRDGLKEKLSYFLFQMPPSFKYTEQNLEEIIEHVPHTPGNVIEFRHVSWWNDNVKDALQQAQITFCNVDFPGLESYFINTTDHFYLRLHGNPTLFTTPYDVDRLQQFYADIPKQATYGSVYFNNTITEAGYQNALQLLDLIKRSNVPVTINE
jgi:uncharacterized protein YecE (DUF72 family)